MNRYLLQINALVAGCYFSGSLSVATLMKVFVYGTLKTGEPNNIHLRSPKEGVARLVGRGRTVVKYPLVISTPYNIPFLLYVPGRGHNVVGEVFEVDDKVLADLDILETHPTFYTRRVERIAMEDGTGREEQCWTYFLRNHKAHLLELPMLEEYSSLGDHKLEYQATADRKDAIDFHPDIQETTPINVSE